jgi:bifunctional DNA-binding transcriptional regulator/antitoxin component of YhaV-PrlF toxin-antitoxin module
VREALGVGIGDRVMLIGRNDQIIMMNAAVYAMRLLQDGMDGEFAQAGLAGEDAVMAEIKAVRAELAQA